MKRFLAILLTALLVIGAFPAAMFSVSAIAPINYGVDFSVESVSAMPGQTVELGISVYGYEQISGLLLYEMQYDSSALEFVEFRDYGELVTNSVAGDNSISSSDKIINLGYSPNIIPNGKICTAVFRVKNSAKEGDYSITFSTVGASDNGAQVYSMFSGGIINVYHWVRGDFDLNNVVNMLDAVYFIGWINFPYTGLYPMVYNGNKDFNHDKRIDMLDAVYFIGWVNFSYTGLYTIDWEEVDFTTDTDGDGLPDMYEINIKLNPNKQDTDDDGILDSDEDPDGDNLTNIQEYRRETDPLNKDTDGDGLTDGSEEYTDPLNPDTDGDGLTDGDEIVVYWTDPLDYDTDGDGANDGWEIRNGFDPLKYDYAFTNIVVTPVTTNDPEVSPSVKMADAMTGEQAQTLKVEESKDESLEQFDGTIGKAYDFSVEGTFTEATLEFEFDENLNDPQDPVIVYVDDSGDATHIYELDTTVTGNVASATVTHFSTYMLVDRKTFKEKNKFIDILGDGITYSAAEVVLVIDASGSMSSNDNSYTRLATAETIINRLSGNVKFGLVKFESYITVYTQTLTSDKEVVKSYLTESNFAPTNSTQMYTGINSALNLFSADDTVAKIMVVLSDGAADSNDRTKHASTIAAAQAKDVHIFTIGLASSSSYSYFQNYLVPLAEQTGGEFNHAQVAEGLWDAFDRVGDIVDIGMDSDSDGIPDYYENKYNTVEFVNAFSFSEQFPLDINNPDSDGDGFRDGIEIKITYYHVPGTDGKETVMVTGVVVSDPTNPTSTPRNK